MKRYLQLVIEPTPSEYGRGPGWVLSLVDEQGHALHADVRSADLREGPPVKVCLADAAYRLVLEALEREP